ncbi:MAG: polyprenyl synthetase family protein, partial [Longimicrobiales bacterium]|nr:polyprenyl synthetase family protein [Longimicrobiales bacterium]
MTFAAEVLRVEPVRSGTRPARETMGLVHGSDERLDRLLTHGLDEAARRMERGGLPVPPRQGKLLRPLFSVAMIPPGHRDRLHDRFWSGALAIQMVHEASLLHDDVIDAASQRRGRPTLVAEEGVAQAVVLGDRYLTGAYRAAASTGSFEFLSRFTEAVERTVVGEMAQGRSAGRRLTDVEYDEIIEGKSGELFGIAAALGSTVLGLGATEERLALGRAFGNLYQRIDDLVDYCHLVEIGKPALQDYRNRKWSWVLGLASVDGFERSDDEIAAAIFGPEGPAPSPARRALEMLQERKREILRRATGLDADPAALDRLLSSCTSVARRHVTEQERRMGLPGTRRPPQDAAMRDARRSEEAVIRRRAEALGGPSRWRVYFEDHARTFSLAARLFPPREAALVTGLYAYCRFTDDLVDDPADDPSAEALARRLDVWRELSLAAFDGTETGIPLLDTVLVQAAEKGVDRAYPEALLEGVGMDLAPRRYRSWE